MTEFSADYWEQRYRSGVASSTGDPSPALVLETAGLPPGRALDAGCGHGANAVFLASRGWDVTAVDVSTTALDGARGRPGGELVTWVHGDLADWQPGEAYDLVTSFYVHLPGPQEHLVARLASWVAPGGTLLLVGHDHGHGHPDGAHLEPARLPGDVWDVVTGPREHAVRRPDGAGVVTLHDVVVRARRRA